jgi:hypothetical protein
MSARRRSTTHPGPQRLLRKAPWSAFVLLGGLCVPCVVPAIALAQNPKVVAPSARNYYESHIAEAARRFRLPSAWIRAVLCAESAGNQRATSHKGAMGLMQIMPETWSDLRSRYRLGGDPYDPRDNIVAGSAYIRELLDRYGSPGWIAAYNAGPGRYQASLRGRPLPRETRAYVAMVASAIGSYQTCPAFSASPDWKRAPLFAVQSVGKRIAHSMSTKRSREDAPPAGTAHDVVSIAPRSIGLFVPTASHGSAP